MFRLTDSLNKVKLVEYLNEILAAENAAIERLGRRIKETSIEQSKKMSQHQLKEEERQQNRLQNLIASCGGKPTNSKADLLSLNSLAKAATIELIKDNTTTLIKLNEKDEEYYAKNHTAMTAKEIEILNTREDAIIKSTEILQYKKIIKIAKKIGEKNTIVILKRNLQEKQLIYDKIRNSESEMTNQIKDNNSSTSNRPNPFKLGLEIADILTSYWNSKENPSKVYLFDRRVHHGTIGALLSLSTLLRKKSPIATSVLLGLGAGLARDDYKDFREWFLFKKKRDDLNG
jgi:ferritin-like metal-binding protein YciE